MPFSRAAAGRFALTLGTTLAVAGTSCLIADPPAELTAPTLPPTIQHNDVVPPAGQILTVFPSLFTVPVQRLDPTAAYEWRFYIDYDPSTGNAAVEDSPAAPVTTSPIRLSEVAPAGGGCHVIEVLVADSFGGSDQDLHTPSAASDSVTWYYSPSGDLSGCPVYTDAGFDGAFPDAGDGGEGGTGP